MNARSAGKNVYISKILCLMSALMVVGSVYNYAGSLRNNTREKAKGGGVTSTFIGDYIHFLANHGQLPKEVKYYALMPNTTTFITVEGRIVYNFTNGQDKSQGYAISEEMLSQKVIQVNGQNAIGPIVNYFKGNDPAAWHRDIESFRTVSLGEVYEGVEVQLQARNNNLEKLFFVNPEGDPASIKVKISGADRLSVNQDGTLDLATSLGEIKFTKPVAYQSIRGQKHPVEVEYFVNDENTYGFEVGDYNLSEQLVIDPLIGATFIGGGDSDIGINAAVNSEGDIYLAGSTSSTNFPTTTGVFDTSTHLLNDVFISKFDGELKNLMASTILGGNDYDGHNFVNIAIDNNENVIVSGSTKSSDFPTTGGAYDRTYNGSGGGIFGDIFVSKLSADLRSLKASTYVGGSNDDSPNAMAFDSSNNIIFAGHSSSSNYPVTPGAYDTTLAGASIDVIISKLDNDLENLLSSTYLGGSNNDGINGITVDVDDRIFISGRTDSSDFPVSGGAYDETYNGGGEYNMDGFISSLDRNLSTLRASTYLGGSDDELAGDIVADNKGNVFVTGQTSSRNFPTTSNVFDRDLGGSVDTFISKFSDDLRTLKASTFLGGSDLDACFAIALDSWGNVFVYGNTSSEDLPVTEGAYDTTFNGGIFMEGSDLFIARLNDNLDTVEALTYIGGSGVENGFHMTLDKGDNVYVSGRTSSNNFPVMPGAYDRNYNGGTDDAFIIKLSRDLSKEWPLLDLTVLKTKVKPKKLVVGGKINIILTITNIGDEPSKATKVDFYFSKKKKVGKKSIKVGSANLATLDAGKKKTIRLNTKISDKIKPSAYYLIIVVDPENINHDTNPGNNRVTSESKISIGDSSRF